MIKILTIGDIHYSDVAPISRNEDYYKHILKKLLECILIAKKLEVDYICPTGDFFHRKSAASFHEAIMLMSVIKRSKIPFVGIGGNHDYTGYNLNTINNRALGCLVESGLIRLLDFNPIESGGILLMGNSYSSMYDMDRHGYVKPDKYDDKFTIAITHGSMCLTDNGTFWGQYTNMNNLRNMEQPIHNIIINGHRHDFQKPYKFKDKNCTVFSDGSLARNILKEDVSKRIPTVRYLKIKDGSFKDELIQLKSAVDFTEAFIIPEAIEEMDVNTIKDFVSLLSKESGELDISNDKNMVKKIIKEYGYDKNVEAQVLDYIENSEEY